MSLRINTNIAALNAQKNLLRTDSALSTSLERLSTGYRINKAADDAAGMGIANSLRSQALGLGQAIRNASDGISVVQTADAALQESISIINSIKTKAIQSAQDGQTTDSRNAIQADINKLMEELDMIAKTTAFNNQKLLSGNFADKKFQVGAYSGETITMSIGSAETTKIGHVTTGDLSVTGQTAGIVELSIYSSLQNQNFQVQSVQVAYDNTSEHSMGAVADAINKLSDVLGISATASVNSSTTNNIVAGTTDSNFKINDVTIGAVTVLTNDADGSLAKAINTKTAQHGITASVDSAGCLTLSSTDNRAIKVTADSITDESGGFYAIARGTDLTTLGYVTLNQQGSSEIIVTNTGGGNVVALTDTGLDVEGNYTTNIDSTAASGSVLKSTSLLAAGWITGQTLSGGYFSGNITTTEASTLKSASILGSGSTIGSTTVLKGSAILAGIATTTGTHIFAADSMLTAGSVLNSGTDLTAAVTISGRTTTADIVLTSGSTLELGTQLAAMTVLTASGTISGVSATLGDIYAGSGSTLAAGTELTSGTVLTAAVTISGKTTTYQIVMASGSVLGDQSTIASGTTLAGTATIADTAAVSGFMLGSGSKLAAGTVLGSGVSLVLSGGYTIGGVAGAQYTLSGGDAAYGLSGTQLLTTEDSNFLKSGSTLTTDTIVGDANLKLQSGQNMTVVGTMTLVTGSVISGGTILGVNSTASGDDLTLQSALALGAAISMTLDSGSVISGGTILAANSYASGNVLTLQADLNLSGAASMTLETGSVISGGTILGVGSVFAGDDLTLQTSLTLGAVTMSLLSGSTINSGSIMSTGSTVGVDNIDLSANMTLTGDMTLATGSTIENTAGTEIAAGSTVGGDVTLASDLNVTGTFSINSGSILKDESILANGSTIGGTVTLAADETVHASTDMEIAAGSVLATGSTIAAGTYLTNAITASGGVTYAAGTLLSEAINTAGSNTMTVEMTLQGGSVMAAGSKLAANAADSAATGAAMGATNMNKLSDLSVLTQDSAQIAIAVAEAALKDLGNVSAGLGSMQNQLTATISNLATTQVNIYSAESNIRDVDFAGEVANFSKLQILMQAGSFAMAQANASSQVVLTLLG